MLALAVSCKNEETMEEPPNVVLFLLDNYGYGDISFEGNTQIKPLHIDRIAKMWGYIQACTSISTAGPFSTISW